MDVKLKLVVRFLYSALKNFILINFFNKYKLFRYWEVVPIEHLLIRLANDGPAVGRLITKLLMNSFFPTNLEDEVSKIIKDKPKTTLLFY